MMEGGGEQIIFAQQKRAKRDHSCAVSSNRQIRENCLANVAEIPMINLGNAVAFPETGAQPQLSSHILFGFSLLLQTKKKKKKSISR